MQGSQASTYHQRRVALDRLHPSIPARYYFDPQHYERELEVFWYSMWVMAGREEEIPAPRDYRVVKVGTQSIVIVRDLEGRLQAFHNTCRHRGSILCTEELQRRPSRPPDYRDENRALVALASALADSPRTILQTLADKVLEILREGVVERPDV